MPDKYMDVDTAIARCPVNLLPLISDVDFTTIEASVAYNAAGLALVWNFTTTAGAFTQTAVTPASTGNYAWTTIGNGMYAIQIPASGGASINNDTEGFGWWTGVATGILPWRSPIICFRASYINDNEVDGLSGAVAWTYTLTDAITGAVIADADVRVTSDSAGATTLASGKTNTAGQVTFYLVPGTVYVWPSKSGYNTPGTGDAEVVS